MKWPIVFALLTALFWGCYGPALAKSRGKLGSPFKPYVAVGVAYLVIGILGGLIGMAIKKDSFSFSGEGFRWGFIAGSLGALGALWLTYAMFTGGSRMPHVVMSLVFGGAATVAGIVGVVQSRHVASANPMLWVGLVGMVVCTILVAYNTPVSHAPAPTSSPPVDTAPTSSAHHPADEKTL